MPITASTTPFPIQAATLPDSLAGRDVLGRGRTGSGKTYAFLLPMVTRLTQSETQRASRRPRALILAPTRELVAQIDAALAPLATAMNLRAVTVFGGVGANPRSKSCARASTSSSPAPAGWRITCVPATLICRRSRSPCSTRPTTWPTSASCPGSSDCWTRTPRRCQRLLFSATLDDGVDILVKRYLHDPVTHSVDSAQSPVSTMTHHVLHVDGAARFNVVADLAAAPGRTIVFARTKHGAKKLARQLNSSGVSAVELHGNLSQNARTRNLAAFSDGTASVLVATDIAARGIHVDDVSLVVHADPPVEHKAYLHRSGRTARAGAEGTVVTVMLDAQVSDVRLLTRKAGVKPTITRFSGATHPVLQQIAPGERTFGEPIKPQAAEHPPASRKPRRPKHNGSKPASSHHTGGNGGRGSHRSRSGGRSHSAASFSASLSRTR